MLAMKILILIEARMQMKITIIMQFGIVQLKKQVLKIQLLLANLFQNFLIKLFVTQVYLRVEP